MYGTVRVAAATPRVRVADPAANAAAVCEQIDAAQQKGVQVLVFPQLCLTGYTCGDLFLQPLLLRGALDALQTVARHTQNKSLLTFVGLPLAYGGKLYNVAAALLNGNVLGLVPKAHLPNYGEFCEARHFAGGAGVSGSVQLPFEADVPFGTDLLFRARGTSLAVSVEIGEDLWAPVPPSCALAAAGATLTVNLSAGSETTGKAAYRRLMVQSQSARLVGAYAYADAGEGESTTDAAFAGHCLLAENGTLLTESTLFTHGLTVADVDTDKLVFERRRLTTFPVGGTVREICFEGIERSQPLLRAPDKLPFVPSDKAERQARAKLVLEIQTAGLCTRLTHTAARTAVLGVSGGLDSTLALLVTARAFDKLGRDRRDILAVTMPGFGTTDETYQNALALCKETGATLRTVDIKAAVTEHLHDIGHPQDARDVTYENAQARTRTLVLMDLANATGGLVVGTGDLSELALGWATYNGDHMSMYGVNASVPKTLIRHLVTAAGEQAGAKLKAIVDRVVHTEISPELLPAKDGKIAQKTEELVGPYALHDFFLYHAVRWGCPPKKVLWLARQAFGDDYDAQTVKKWLQTFYRRLFAQQFKRSCLPDGVKTGSVSLSPRGDWRMPSDACADLWLRESETL